jgi:hypothetical protein
MKKRIPFQGLSFIACYDWRSSHAEAVNLPGCAFLDDMEPAIQGFLILAIPACSDDRSLYVAVSLTFLVCAERLYPVYLVCILQFLIACKILLCSIGSAERTIGALEVA